MEISHLSHCPRDWNTRIERYQTKTLFHEREWLRYVHTIHPRGELEFFELRDDGAVVGYLSALRIRKLGMTILGSPLGGTGTNYMGPVVNGEVDQVKFANALVNLCRRDKVCHLEISNAWLESDVMRRSGFDAHCGLTRLCELSDTEEQAWESLTSACRNRIRKAVKNGGTAVVVEDESIVHEYCEQLREVYAKQGMVAPYGVGRVRSLFENLQPAGRLFAIRVMHEGRSVATGLFPHDDRCMYFWGGASWLKDQHLCPNELLHWTAIRLAVAHGIPAYNMCGGGSRFKAKFGGAEVPFVTYSMSSLRLLRAARRMYRSLHFAKLRARGIFQRAFPI